MAGRGRALRHQWSFLTSHFLTEPSGCRIEGEREGQSEASWVLEMKGGGTHGGQNSDVKQPNFPCRFSSCTQGAVKTWESGGDRLGSGRSVVALATVLIKGSSQRFLV